MKSNYKRLGNYIREVDVRDTEETVELLLGVSIQKKFIPSIANIIGTDMSTYKIVKRNQFAYGPVTSRNGDKISVALLEEYDEAIISQAYLAFEILDFNELLPDYLMMWFRRPEFDRYARFKSHGSAREIFDWEAMCDTYLPVPSISKQREIVEEYRSIQSRFALNQKMIHRLEETAQEIYRQWFVTGLEDEVTPNGWSAGTVRNLCEYSNKKISINKIDPNNYISTENMLVERGGIVTANSSPKIGNATHFESGNVLISNIRPYFKKIWLAEFSGGCSNDVLCFVPKPKVPSLYLYQVLEKNNFFDYVMAGSKGTKMPRGDKKWIMDYPVVIPSDQLLEEFDKVATVLKRNVLLKKQENRKLAELNELLLSKLATIENGVHETQRNQ